MNANIKIVRTEVLSDEVLLTLENGIRINISSMYNKLQLHFSNVHNIQVGAWGRITQKFSMIHQNEAQ